MRVTMQNLYTNNLNSLQNTTYDVARLNQMLSKGVSILSPSDDPIGAAKILENRTELKNFNQFEKEKENTLNKKNEIFASIGEIENNSDTSFVLVGLNDVDVSVESKY